MGEDGGLVVVDGLELPARYREVLRPGAPVLGADGRERQLPRFFYEVDSWERAREVRLARHFTLSEFLEVDVREAAPLRDWPRYVPCAVTLLAAHLELLRAAVGTYVFIAANGGYRSPGHARGGARTVHAWGTAADIYRIGDTYLDGEEPIERYGTRARELSASLRPARYGMGPGETDDHLHVDIGYARVDP